MPTPSPHHLPDDLAALYSALVDGTLTVEEQRELEQRLLTDRAARDAFRSFMEMESILAWELVAGAQGGEGRTARDGSTVPSVSLPWWRQAAAWLVPLVSAVSAAVVAAIVVAIAPLARPTVQSVTPPAEVQARAWLVDATGAVWADGVVRRAGQRLPDGPLRLEAGAAQLRFDSGAVVALNGPTEIEVLGGNRLFLRSGKIMPYVPPGAKGFTVVSPTGEVIDLGTEFTVSVDANGQTEVFVVDGEVDVARGHGDGGHLVRATQGFGTRLDTFALRPEITARPLIIDDFNGPSRAVRWRDLDSRRAARVAGGELAIPVEFRAADADERGRTQIVLDHDFGAMQGRATRISYKATLPDAGLAVANRWLACVIDDGRDAPPMAYESSAALGVLVSPHFQAGVRVDGKALFSARVFGRSEDAIGPYQVLITIDDTPAAHARHGSAVAAVSVNGQELIRQQPIRLGDRPRISLQTFIVEGGGGPGQVLVDDFSVSVSADDVAAAGPLAGADDAAG
jgi:hypothetical protein